MKIKEILIESFQSPFFNLLAISNLALIAMIGSYGSFQPGGFANIVCDLNRPAILTSIVLMRSFDSAAAVPPLVYLQWIFIGAFAKFVAFHFRPMENDPS